MAIDFFVRIGYHREGYQSFVFVVRPYKPARNGEQLYTEVHSMKMTDILKKVIGLSLLVAAVAGTVAYIVFKITGERAYREKWKDYIDCGLA